MALDSNQPIAGSGLEIRYQFIEHLMALRRDRGFARFKPKLLHQITEAESGFAGDILDLELAWRSSHRRTSHSRGDIRRLLGGLRDRHGLRSVTLHPKAIALENAGDRLYDHRCGSSVFDGQDFQFAHNPLRKVSSGPNHLHSVPRPNSVFPSPVQIDDIPLPYQG